jgi:predicted nucleic acid-binding Zn ribbon protein
MEQIKSIVADVIKDILAKQERGPGGDIAELWNHGATKKVSQHTKSNFFKNGTLYINVENSAWLYELKSKQAAILKKLKKISKNKIIDVKFKIGDIDGN